MAPDEQVKIYVKLMREAQSIREISKHLKYELPVAPIRIET